MRFPQHQHSFTGLAISDWNVPVQLTWTDLGRYLLVTLCAAIVLALRQPSSLLRAGFVFEDGATFFAQAYNLTTVEALTQIYAGYWHVIPRIVAEIGTLLPVRQIPLFYNLSALFLTAATVSWFILPLNRSIVANPWIRLVVISLILLTPRLDGLMLIAYVQWFLAVWAVFVLLGQPPRQRWLLWTIAAAYMLVVFSVPALVMVIPLWLLRGWVAGRASLRWWSALIAATTLTATLLVMSIPKPPILSDGNLGLALQDTLRGLSYRGFTLTFLGIPAGDTLILQVGWWTSYLFATILVLLLAVGFVSDQRPGKRAMGLFLLYLAIATASLYLIRAELYGFPYANADSRLPYGGGRYFFVAATLILIGVAVQVERLIAANPRFTWIAAGATILVVLVNLGAFRMAAWPNADWAIWSDFISRLSTAQSAEMTPAAAVDDSALLPLFEEANTRYPVGDNQLSSTPRPSHHRDTYVVRVPIAPSGWYATLYVPNRWHGVADFPEGLRLLDYSVKTEGANLLVDLFWIGETRPAPSEESFFTAYVHLIDAAGERVAGYDVLLERGDDNSFPEDVLRSHHVLEPPQSPAGGPLSLSVGLYQLTDSGLIPGASVVLTDTVEWPAVAAARE